MKLFQNAPVAIKVALAPICLLLLLAAITGVAMMSDQVKQVSVNEAREIAVKRVGVANETAVVGNRVQANLFRLSTFALMQSKQEELKPIYDDLNRDLAHVKDAFARLSQEKDAQDAAMIDEMAATLTGFMQNSNNALIMLRSNPSFGATITRAAAVRFDAFLNKVDDYGKLQHQRLNASIDRTVAEIDKGRVTLTTAFAVAVGLALVIAWIVVASIARPVAMVTRALVKIAAGERAEISVSADRRDELGQMLKAAVALRDNLESVTMRLADESQATEAQRLATEREQDRARFVQTLLDRFHQAAGARLAGLANSADVMLGSTRSMQDAVERTADQSHFVSSASTEMQARIGGVAAAVGQLSKAIRDISYNVDRSSNIMVTLDNQMRAASQAANGLATAASEIGQVTEIINSVARQTNLLALNATIEAARAGDAGKGFAVVATEVKTLANQTMNATADIGRQISAIQQTTSAVVQAIGAVANGVDEINKLSTGISSNVEEQSAASNSIAADATAVASASQEAQQGIGGLDRLVRETRVLANELTDRSRSVDSDARALAEALEGLLRDIQATSMKVA